MSKAEKFHSELGHTDPCATPHLTPDQLAAVQDLSLRQSRILAFELERLNETLLQSQTALQTLRYQNTQLLAEQSLAQSRDLRRQVQLHLLEWKLEWLGSKPRFGKMQGPTGAPLRTDMAHLSAHPHFSAQWYLQTYKDVQSSRLTAAEHFLRHGLFEGRDPGPYFKTLPWFEKNLEALKARRYLLLE